ncbi:MAG: hypothetical protein CMB77_01240 [Euryarchaeota archaeon]|nr:hypothetical protein [Euryarchaeota archaeon]
MAPTEVQAKMTITSRVACVCIPTINAAGMLKQALATLKNQDWNGELEIWVIDSNSVDDTEQVCEDFGVKWILDESRTRADACNFGIQQIHSAHPNDDVIVLFTDDDALLPSDWITSHLKWYDREEVAGVGGQNWAPPDDPWSARCADVVIGARWITSGTRYGEVPAGELTQVSHNPGVNASYRLSALLEVGGFAKGSIGAEDVELDARLRDGGFKLWFDPTISVGHRRRTIRPFSKQMMNYGKVRWILGERRTDVRTPTHHLIAWFPVLTHTILGIMLLSTTLILTDISHFMTSTMAAHTLFIASSIIIGLYLILCWAGAALGNSPRRTLSTVLAAPLFAFIAHYGYGTGVRRGKLHVRQHGSAAGIGKQIDDRTRDIEDNHLP